MATVRQKRSRPTALLLSSLALLCPSSSQQAQRAQGQAKTLFGSLLYQDAASGRLAQASMAAAPAPGRAFTRDSVSIELLPGAEDGSGAVGWGPVSVAMGWGSSEGAPTFYYTSPQDGSVSSFSANLSSPLPSSSPPVALLSGRVLLLVRGVNLGSGLEDLVGLSFGGIGCGPAQGRMLWINASAVGCLTSQPLLVDLAKGGQETVGRSVVVSVRGRGRSSGALMGHEGGKAEVRAREGHRSPMLWAVHVQEVGMQPTALAVSGRGQGSRVWVADGATGTIVSSSLQAQTEPQQQDIPELFEHASGLGSVPALVVSEAVGKVLFVHASTQTLECLPLHPNTTHDGNATHTRVLARDIVQPTGLTLSGDGCHVFIAHSHGLISHAHLCTHSGLSPPNVVPLWSSSPVAVHTLLRLPSSLRLPGALTWVPQTLAGPGLANIPGSLLFLGAEGGAVGGEGLRLYTSSTAGTQLSWRPLLPLLGAPFVLSLPRVLLYEEGRGEVLFVTTHAPRNRPTATVTSLWAFGGGEAREVWGLEGEGEGQGGEDRMRVMGQLEEAQAQGTAKGAMFAAL